MSMIKIAVHQMCSGLTPTYNASMMVDAIAQAAAAGAQMYFGPEMSILIDRNRKRASAHVDQEGQSAALDRIRIAATEAGIWVHTGSIPVRSGDDLKYANRSVIIDPAGVVRARYDKMHLFDVDLATGESWRESSIYMAGEKPVIVETPLGPLGLAICYDLRFPDLFSALSRVGVNALAVPSAFTVPTGAAHWHVLLRARAIEAQAFVIAAAQSGEHEDGRVTYGHSLVVDPWGEVILDMGEGEGLGFAELDLGRLAEVRAQIPVHANRRNIPAEVKRY